MDAIEESRPRSEFLPLSILRAVWKRKIVIVATWLAVVAVGVAYIYSLPAVYEARTVILIERQRVPERFIASTVNEDLANRLNRIRQTILSYEALVELINNFNLYADQRGEMVQEEMVADLHSRIKMALVDGWAESSAPAFAITYQGPDPQVAARLVNSLGDKFIEENIRTRYQQAQGTSEFMQSQLDDARQELERQEAAVSEFKLRNNGELPEQENAILGAVRQAENELSAIEAAVNRAYQNKVMLENQLAAARSSLTMLEQLAEQEQRVAAERSSSSPDSPRTLVEAERRLQDLQVRYHQDHPDVRRAQAVAEQLRAGAAPQEAANAGDETPAEPLINRFDQSMLAERQRIKNIESQLELLAEDVEKLARRREQERANFAATQERLRRLPIRQQEQAQVVRNYDISVSNYKSLLDRRLEAEVAARLEVANKAERFSKLEPARVPSAPVKPDRLKLTAMVLGGGLFAAALLGFVLELRRNVVLGEWELGPGVATLGLVPHMSIVSNGGGAAASGHGASLLPRRALIASSVLLSLAAVVATGFYLGWLPL